MSEYSIGEALNKFLQRSHLKNGVRAIQIEEIWEKLMGKTIAQYTDKIQIVNQKLFITTSVGPLKNELMYQKNQIIERVNEAFGEKIISEVIIQ
jgi:predicted nucleic acid-binding Zn ribbon protein